MENFLKFPNGVQKKCTSVSKSKVKKLTSAAQAELCIFSFQNMLYLYLFVNKKKSQQSDQDFRKISKFYFSGF